MKYLLSLLILITPILNAKVDESEQNKHKQRVLKILDRSAFGKSRPPELKSGLFENLFSLLIYFYFSESFEKKLI